MKKILIVEDDTPVRENLVELLSAEGFFPLEARDGEEGARLAWEMLPDLILCDISMPRLDGFGMLSRIIRDPATATIPFIFLTARNEREDLRRGMSLGADDYIMKPFSIDDVLKAIETRLEKRTLIKIETEKIRSELSQNLYSMLPDEMLTPISVVLGLSDLISKHEEVHGMEVGQINHIGREIHQAANQLLRLIQNYRLYSDLEALQADDVRLQALRSGQVLSAQSVITELAEMKARHENRSTDLLVHVENAVLGISEVYLVKMVEELLDNAFRFSQAGSVVELTGEIQAEYNKYRLQIRDFGRGMPPDQAAVLGGRLGIKNGPSDQRGMGLAIVRRLAELHQCDFSLQSQLDQWTVIEIRFPVCG